MNKAAFMNELTKSLSEYGVNDAREILLDFEQHFEDGKMRFVKNLATRLKLQSSIYLKQI